jgi:predicted homoserine dehydrogenase-like protein
MIHQDLLEYQRTHGHPIRVGVSGAGWLGSGFVTAIAHVAGMTVNVLADTDVSAARQAFLNIGVPPDQIVEADKPGHAMDALRAGRRVVTASYALAAQLEDVDIVADATPSPAIGAETAYAGIQHGKDVVMVNIEADVTVGRILHKMAREAGVLYTVSSGDEPGCLMELVDFVTTLGYEVIVIGKGKNNPLDPTATPDTVAESARRAGKDPFPGRFVCGWHQNHVRNDLRRQCHPAACPCGAEWWGRRRTWKRYRRFSRSRRMGGSPPFRAWWTSYRAAR